MLPVLGFRLRVCGTFVARRGEAALIGNWSKNRERMLSSDQSDS